jgi:selenide,water dikinase
VYVGGTVRFGSSVSEVMQSALFDPQTAGGLLISLDKSKARDFLSSVPTAVPIGRVREKDDHLIEVN